MEEFIGIQIVKICFGAQWIHRLHQWRSGFNEKVMHIKGRLLDQAMTSTAFLFKMGTSLKDKNLLPEGANSFLYEKFLIVWKITFIIITLSDLP